MNNHTEKVHAIFDETSFYRLATNESLWSDRGETAIRRYFEGNRRAEIARQYILGEEIGAVVPDWGFSKELNQMLHDFRMGNRLKEDPNEIDSIAEAESVSPMRGTPVDVKYPLFRVELSLEGVEIQGPEENSSIFRSAQDSPTQDKFTVNISKVPVGRQWCLLVISEPILRLLQCLVGLQPEEFPKPGQSNEQWFREIQSRCTSEIREHSTARRVLHEMFKQLQEPSEETEENLPQIRKSWWIATTLANAVGVTGSPLASEGRPLGALLHSIDLNRPSPSLAQHHDRHWAVLCIGDKI